MGGHPIPGPLWEWLSWMSQLWTSPQAVKNGPEDQLFSTPLLRSALSAEPEQSHTPPLLLWMTQRRRSSALPHDRAGASILTRVPRKMLAGSWFRGVMPIMCCSGHSNEAKTSGW